MISLLIVIFILLTAIFICYQVYRWKNHLSDMNGMMIAMAMAMMVSLAIGIVISAEVSMNPTLSTIYTIVIGIFIGYITGYPFGILAQLDGVLAGIMGGLMGPMTGLMISNQYPNLFVGFFTLLYVFTTILVYQLIQKALPTSISKRINQTWFLFLPICIILTILAITQSNVTPLSTVNSEKITIQKTNYQEAKIKVESTGYTPNRISVKVGIPVKLHFQKNSTSGCLSYLLIPELKINKELKMGDNIISFIPKKAGNITFTCGMGMYHGSILIK